MPRLFSTLSTVPRDTPASAAICFIVAIKSLLSRY
jgi:hypothetical protein